MRGMTQQKLMQRKPGNNVEIIPDHARNRRGQSTAQQHKKPLSPRSYSSRVLPRTSYNNPLRRKGEVHVTIYQVVGIWLLSGSRFLIFTNKWEPGICRSRRNIETTMKRRFSTHSPADTISVNSKSLLHPFSVAPSQDEINNHFIDTWKWVMTLLYLAFASFYFNCFPFVREARWSLWNSSIKTSCNICRVTELFWENKHKQGWYRQTIMIRKMLFD